MISFFEQAKSIIEYIARGVEFAAALIIGIAAVEATVKALGLFVDRTTPASAKNEVRLTLGRWLAVLRRPPEAHLHDAHPVAFFGKPVRRHAASEPGADYDEIEIHESLRHYYAAVSDLPYRNLPTRVF